MTQDRWTIETKVESYSMWDTFPTWFKVIWGVIVVSVFVGSLIALYLMQ